MKQTTLGLDLGITSIGWAYISEEDGKFELNGWGSRIFEAGMDDDIDSGKGVSRCAERRSKRALRIQYRRRRKRKKDLIICLKENGLLPENPSPEFFTPLDRKLLQTFSGVAQRPAAHVLSYLYRKAALDRPLEPHELGRVLFHLAQRRGYKSNRKKDLKDPKNGVVKKGISQLRQLIENTGARTLGEYFSTLDAESERIRSRYTDRSMYEEEFRKICAAQRQLIPPEVEKKLFRIIFYQRPLKSCKHLVRRCPVYPEEHGCSYLREEAQLFRIYTTVNHLRIECKGVIRPLTPDEREAVIAVLNGFSGALNQIGMISLKQLAKQIRLKKGEVFTLSDEEKEIYGNVLHTQLFRAFGERAEHLPEPEREKFFHDLTSIEKEDTLKRRLTSYWKLEPEKSEEVARMAPPSDYCAYSLKALKELLPDLEAGIALNAIKKVNHPVHMQILDRLPRLDSPECRIELRNPVVHRVLTELRNVVNALIARYGKLDRIRIELARNLKNTNREREQDALRMREREKQRQTTAEKIAQEAGIENPSRKDVEKVLLAEECDYHCPYTGKGFSMTELLHGMTIQVEHIIPFSRSFDDSFSNKTLCETSANGAKNNRTPFEAFSGERYQEILERVKHFKGPMAERKLELFKLEKVDSQEFLERNLNDTRYASKLAEKYLALLYGGEINPAGKRVIFTTSGRCTAMLRRAWGGNYLLGEGEKIRFDHRHHAIDALTIALTTPELVRRIAGMTEEQRRKFRELKQPCLGNAIYRQAEKQLENAAVSHHTLNKLRGAFHKDTFYSKVYCSEGATCRHCRIPLAGVDARDLPDIIDPAIKKLVAEKLGVPVENLGNVDQKKLKIFQDRENLPVLKDRCGNPVNTISKVRVAKNFETRTIGSGQNRRHVANKNNYLLAVFARLDAAGNETAWEGEVVPLLDARQRHDKGLAPFEKNRDGLQFKFTLKKGDIVLWEKDGKALLCIVRGISLPQFSLVPVRDARMQKELKQAHEWFTPTLSGAFNGKMKKYRMNLFGELQRAND